MNQALARRTLTGEVLGRAHPSNPLADLLRALLGEQKPPPQFLTLKEAAEHTGLSVTFLRRLIKAGKLPALRDRCYKVRRYDLDNLPRMAEMSKYGQRMLMAASSLRAVAARRSR